MKLLIGFIVICFVSSSIAASDLSSIERKQRKLVSRFYEILEMLPERCPESSRNEYLKSVTEFRKEFPEFISLIQESKYRPYAIKKFSNRSPVTGQECLYIRDALDMHIESEKGRESMSDSTKVMLSNG